MLNELMTYLQFPFVRYALIVSILISLCSSLLGVILVLRRYSYLGDGLSHVAFGSMAVATIADLSNNMLLVLPVTVIAAVLALGYLLMNLFPTSANISGDVCTTLFGSTSILTLGKSEVYLCAALSVIVLTIYIIFYNKIFAVTFDESFMQATGINAPLYNLLVAVIVAVIIVLAMNLVGSLLISALVIFPALSAMRVYRSFRSVTVCAAVLSVICALLGLLIAIVAGSPVGSTIVAVNIAAFAVFALIGKLKARG